VVFRGSFGLAARANMIEGASRLDAFSVYPAIRSYPAMDLAVQLAHQGYVLPNPLRTRKNPLKFAGPTADRDRPGSRRSEPSSRTTLMGEQPQPLDRLQPRM